MTRERVVHYLCEVLHRRLRNSKTLGQNLCEVLHMICILRIEKTLGHYLCEVLHRILRIVKIIGQYLLEVLPVGYSIF